MRNRYAGTCYYCGSTVEKQAGHFEKINKGWRVIHAECVFRQREEKRQRNELTKCFNQPN